MQSHLTRVPAQPRFLYLVKSLFQNYFRWNVQFVPLSGVHAASPAHMQKNLQNSLLLNHERQK